MKKYDTNRDGKIGREEMNAGSKRIATEYQRSTNTLRAQNPERQKLQANAKKERSDLVKCIQNPTKCVSKVNSVQEPCAKCFAVHILKFEIYSYHMKNKTKNIKMLDLLVKN